jgi:hypothetical protein
MEPLFAILGLAVAFAGTQIGYLAGLDRGRRERAAQPPVISFVPSSLTVPPAPWRSSTGPPPAPPWATPASANPQPVQLPLTKAPLAPYQRNAATEGRYA